MPITMKCEKYYVHSALIFAATLCVIFAQDHEPQVNMTFGQVSGIWLKTRDADVAGFLGLPYAQPPVGDLRFENPQPWIKKWNHTRNATKDGSMCLQVTEKRIVVGDEDCLYLNVFTPTITKNQNITARKKLSVIAFIHGGAFNEGSSNSTLYAPTYLLDHEVVLVTMNYRLNVFGFFSTGNDVTPGNYGLKDIAMALRWIHDNIEIFGGDPNSVTLLGLNSGAASAHLLSASKSTEGLFQKLITMSGSATAPWTFHTRDRIRNVSMTVAYRLNCHNTTADFEELGSGDEEIETTTIIQETVDNTENDRRIVECLKRADANDIILAGQLFKWRRNPVCVFGPTLEAEAEGAVLTVHPTQAPYRDMPWITGVTDDEGLLKTSDLYLSEQIKAELVQNYDDYLLPYVLEMENVVSNITTATQAITNFYFKGDATANLIENLTQAFGDGAITWPTYDSLRKQAKNMKSNVYFYLFGYKGSFSNTFRPDAPIVMGVAHGDDLNYLFPYLNVKFADFHISNTLDDTTMINIMSEMWTNFAKTGEPSARLTSTWEPYQKHHRYMRIGDGSSSHETMQVNFLSERMAFWADFAKKYSAPIEEYRVGGESQNSETGGKDSDKSRAGVAAVRAGLPLLLSVILCWRMTFSFLL
ncbi:esterase E4-like isoform X1 [Phymastichus coffea]|uniref:esterase E4-like isoform X1 n=1 Tax=Phymastichus coffea TaxID=108790 RepID=UPI00273ADAEA|nr:esterase E4-like isoform X1 [Phymastichus coffea]XP_058801481.1 esterase E4-like isoform X1 [Phymastichus coffea]